MGDMNPAQHTAALGSGKKNIFLMVQEDCQPKCTNTLNAGRELMETWMFHHSLIQTSMYKNSFPQSEDTMHRNALTATDSHSTRTCTVPQLQYTVFGFLTGW